MDKASLIFGTVGSPKSTPPKPGGSVGAILHLAAQDLRALELAWVQSVRVSVERCAQIRRAAEEQAVRLSIHAPYYINLNASEEEWPRGRKRLMDAAHFGHLAGATDIVFHPGSYFGGPREAVLALAITRLRDCVDELRSAGNTVILRPETMGKASLLGSLADVLAMSREVEGILPCLDFSHLHARAGDGSLNTHDEWRKVLTDYQTAIGKKRLKRLHCHLSGIEYGPKGERNHVMLAESDLDLHSLLQALADFQCEGRILCESPEHMDQDAQLIRSLWRQTADAR